MFKALLVPPKLNELARIQFWLVFAVFDSSTNIFRIILKKSNMPKLFDNMLITIEINIQRKHMSPAYLYRASLSTISSDPYDFVLPAL